MTLMECVLAVAVIALALPAVMLVLSHSQAAATGARMDGEARRAILQHAHELAREGPGWNADRMIWAHAASGECLGRVAEPEYQRGLSRYGGVAVRYLVVAAIREDESSDLGCLCLSLEHPAAAPRAQRKRIEAYTCIHP